MKVDTRTLNEVLSHANFLRGHWNASKRVKGWGSSTEGFEVVRDFDSKFIEKNRFASRSRRWKEVKTTTGFHVTYSLGSRDNRVGVEYDVVRLALPPKVANVIVSQRDSLTTRRRRIAGVKQAKERMARGVMPAFLKKRKKK